MSDVELSLAVVGIDYPNEDRSKSNRRFELLQCVPGEPVLLRREPRNPHDENAVAVFSQRGIQVGYLNAERAPFIGGRMLNETFEAVFQSLEPTIAVIRIRFGGGMPTLPSPRARPAPVDDDFFPDPEPGEWGA